MFPKKTKLLFKLKDLFSTEISVNPTNLYNLETETRFDFPRNQSPTLGRSKLHRLNRPRLLWGRILRACANFYCAVEDPFSMLGLRARAARNFHLHRFKRVSDLCVAAGQTIIETNCQVGPVLCVFSVHDWVPARVLRWPVIYHHWTKELILQQTARHWATPFRRHRLDAAD